jgi:hypothetical protein
MDCEIQEVAPDTKAPFYMKIQAYITHKEKKTE